MDTAQLRLCFVDVLKGMPANGVNQLGPHLMQEIAYHAGLRNFIAHQERGSERLPAGDENKVRELFWSFIIQGILIPGLNASNTQLPFFSVTDYGHQVINSKDPVPHDPDQYLQHLCQIAPKVDPVALAYISEGLECFQRGTYTASAIMLGVASEKLALDLARTVQSKLTGSEASNLLRVIEREPISRIYEETRKRLDPRLPKLPRTITDGLEDHLDGVFAVIRTHRNQAGHPSGQMVDRLTALGLFSTFPFYCRRASDLITHIEAHGLP